MSGMDLGLVNSLIALANSATKLVEDVRTGKVEVDVEEKEKYRAGVMCRYGYSVRLRRDADLRDSVQDTPREKDLGLHDG